MRVHVARIRREAARGEDWNNWSRNCPAYEDKVSRRGLRVTDAMDPVRFDEKVRELMGYQIYSDQSV